MARVRGLMEVFELTVLDSRLIDGRHGTVELHRMADAAGNRAVWFQSGGALTLDPGST